MLKNIGLIIVCNLLMYLIIILIIKIKEKRRNKNFADFYVSVPCGGSDLWHDQLSYAGNAELVLVRDSRMCLCMAGCYGSIL